MILFLRHIILERYRDGLGNSPFPLSLFKLGLHKSDLSMSIEKK